MKSRILTPLSNRSRKKTLARKQAVRRGSTWLIILVVLAVAAGAFAYYSFRPADKSTDAYEGLITETVAEGPFEHIVLEQGEIESSSSIEIRCEVKARTGGSGVTILDILPEGAKVEKGDVMVRLDSRALETDRTQQQIACFTSNAAMITAENALESAKIAKEEYLDGTYKESEQAILSEVFVAEGALRTAELARNSTERLSLKGIVNPLQLEGEQYACEKARKDLQAAKTKLNVLQRYTKKRTVNDLDSAIKVAEAELNSKKNSDDLEKQKLKEIDDQIEKCTIKAPQAGQVVYANKYSQGGRSGTNAEFVVEAGAQVREQQPIIRLPDSNKMQVKATVNESRIRFVRAGLPAAIRADALKDVWLEGEVVKVNQYAEPGGWSSGNIKRYAAYVKIKDPPPELRVNMNAEVRIYSQRIPSAIQVPVQAVVEHKQKFFCVVEDGKKYKTVEVQRKATNDKFFAIEGGVSVGQNVVMSPRGFAGLLNLPNLPDPGPTPDEVAGGPEAKGPPPGVPTGEPGKGPPAGAGPGGGGAPGGGRPGFSPEMFVSRWMNSDTDSDGKLSVAELDAMEFQEFPGGPDAAAQRKTMKDGDTNKDGHLDSKELDFLAKQRMADFKAMQAKRAASGQGGGGGGAGGN